MHETGRACAIAQRLSALFAPSTHPSECVRPLSPLRVRGPIEPLPGWSGVLHHVLVCCCPSAISAGPLTQVACMLCTHGLHSEDYRANMRIRFIPLYRVYEGRETPNIAVRVSPQTPRLDSRQASSRLHVDATRGRRGATCLSVCTVYSKPN